MCAHVVVAVGAQPVHVRVQPVPVVVVALDVVGELQAPEWRRHRHTREFVRSSHRSAGLGMANVGQPRERVQLTDLKMESRCMRPPALTVL